LLKIFALWEAQMFFNAVVIIIAVAAGSLLVGIGDSNRTEAIKGAEPTKHVEASTAIAVGSAAILMGILYAFSLIPK